MNASSPLPSFVLDTASINAPFVIGYTLCFGLMGTLVVQAYIYFTRFTDDRRTIKAFVTVILLLEIMITVFVFAGFWSSVQEFQSVLEALSTQTSQTVQVPGVPSIGPTVTAVATPLALAPIAGLVTTLTHGFYCWRIMSFRKFRLIPLPIMMVSIFQLVSIIRFSVTDGFFPIEESSKKNGGITENLSPWLVTWLAGSALCDLAITICITLSLRPSKSNFGSNKSILVKLTRFTIETGLVTTVAALLELVLGVVFQQFIYHVAVFYAISKLYANCLLASLNFRLVLRTQSNPNLKAIVWEEEVSELQLRQLGPRAQSSYAAPIVARVDTNIDTVIDVTPTSPRMNGPVEDLTFETYELAVKSAWV